MNIQDDCNHSTLGPQRLGNKYTHEGPLAFEKVRTIDGVNKTAICKDGIVYYSSQHNLLADTIDGTPVWKIEGICNLRPISLAIYKDVLVFSQDSGIYQIALQEGSIKQSYIFDQRGFGESIVSRNHLLFTSLLGGLSYLTCIDIETGKTLWDNQVDHLFQYVCASESSVVMSNSQIVQAYNIESGRIIWTKVLSEIPPLSNYMKSCGMGRQPMILGDQCILPVVNSYLVGVSLADGTENWRIPLKDAGPTGRTLLTAEGIAFIPGTNFYFIDVLKGQVDLRVEMQEEWISKDLSGPDAPIWIGDCIYFGDYARAKVMAFNVHTHELTEAFKTDSWEAAEPFVANGHYFFHDSKGNMSIYRL